MFQVVPKVVHQETVDGDAMTKENSPINPPTWRVNHLARVIFTDTSQAVKGRPRHTRGRYPIFVIP